MRKLLGLALVGLITASVQASIVTTDSGAILTGNMYAVTNTEVTQSWIDSQGSAPVDNANNLLQNHVTSVTYSGTMVFGSVLANINDGVMVSNGGNAGNTANFSAFSSGGDLVFQLDGAYNLGTIDSYTAWTKSRIGQKYDAFGSTDGGLTWNLLFSVDAANFLDDGNGYMRGISSTGIDANGVNAIKISISDPNGGDGTAIYAEFAAYEVPEPATMVLLALGGVAGLIRRRK